MIERTKAIVAILMLVVGSSLFAAETLYDRYENEPQYREFDELMNRVRFPTNNQANQHEWCQQLQKRLEQFPNYPDKSRAYYFLGSNYYQLAEYDAAKSSLSTALALDSELANKTPVVQYLKEINLTLRRTKQQNIAISIVAIWSAVVTILLLHRLFIKKQRWQQQELKYAISVILLLTLISCIFFSIDTSSSAKELDEFYLSPVLVESTILSQIPSSLWTLWFITIFTLIITSIAFLALHNSYFAILTAIIIGTASTWGWQLLYQTEYKRIGSGLFKRISFPEKPILWHKDVPDEMIKMYDKDMQEVIRAAKEAASSGER